MKKNLGISLLEILLVIAVIGVITTLSFRYFSSTDANLKSVRAIHEINRVTEASYVWLQEGNRADFSHPQVITISDLIQAGLLMQKDKKNSWGGSIVVKPGENSRYVRIEMAGLSKQACSALTKQLQTVSHASAPSCAKKKDNMYYGDF